MSWWSRTWRNYASLLAAPIVFFYMLTVLIYDPLCLWCLVALSSWSNDDWHVSEASTTTTTRFVIYCYFIGLIYGSMIQKVVVRNRNYPPTYLILFSKLPSYLSIPPSLLSLFSVDHNSNDREASTKHYSEHNGQILLLELTAAVQQLTKDSQIKWLKFPLLCMCLNVTKPFMHHV